MNAEDARVDAHRCRTRQAVGKCSEQRAHAGNGDADAERGAGRRQQQAFRHELAQQPHPARAERSAYRKLAMPRFSTRQQQVRKIGARDQQYERDRALQHPDRARGAADDLRLQRVVPQPMTLRVRRVHALIRRRVCDPGRRLLPPGEKRVELGTRTAFGYAVREPSDEI